VRLFVENKFEPTDCFLLPFERLEWIFYFIVKRESLSQCVKSSRDSEESKWARNETNLRLWCTKMQVASAECRAGPLKMVSSGPEGSFAAANTRSRAEKMDKSSISINNQQEPIEDDHCRAIRLRQKAGRKLGFSLRGGKHVNYYYN